MKNYNRLYSSLVFFSGSRLISQSLSACHALCLSLSHDLTMTDRISLEDRQKRKRKKSLETACRHVIVHPGRGTRWRKAAIPCMPKSFDQQSTHPQTFPMLLNNNGPMPKH